MLDRLIKSGQCDAGIAVESSSANDPALALTTWVLQTAKKRGCLREDLYLAA